ncbi:GNAT family N-acetyltransferase, partial [bacterium]|nr:GNAT family N-acetyltransferase [bacterium]
MNISSLENIDYASVEQFEYINKRKNVSDYKNREKKRFVFKELSTRDELYEMFALRYFTYRYVNFIKPNKCQLDIDCFDMYSTFLGVFEENEGAKRLVGIVRIVSTHNKSRFTNEIADIAANSNGRDIAYLYTRNTLLPIMHTFDDIKERFNNHCIDGNNNSNGRDLKVYEISRLVIHPDYWGSKIRIESGLHELIILDAWKSTPKKYMYVIATHPRTRRRYERLGFRMIPGTGKRIYKDINKLAIAMEMNL